MNNNNKVSGTINGKGEVTINGVRMTDEEISKAYLQYVDMVYRIALVKTKNQTQAEDIQQDVFEALIRYSDRIRSEEHLKAWLIRVTTNACKKHFRSLWIKLFILYDDSLYKEQEEKTDGWSNEPSYEIEDEETEQLDFIREQVEALPEQYRIVIHLFYYEQMRIQKIAEYLHLSEQNVKTRLSRARERLRKKMLEERSR